MYQINRVKSNLVNVIISVILLKDIDLNVVAAPFKKFLDKLPYDDKLSTVRTNVDKVIAIKEKVEICGSIPVLQPITE